MTSWKKPTDELVETALASAKKETGRRYFFSSLKNPLWLQPLVKRRYFESPPGPIRLQDGSDDYPLWPELEYLKNIVGEVPDEVVQVILQFTKIDNPRVDREIAEIALLLPGVHSAKLKPLLLSSARTYPRFLAHRYPELLSHWIAEKESLAALQLTEILVKFVPDPDSEDKQLRRRQNPEDWMTLLRPSPSIDSWEFREVLEKGVHSLAEMEPYQVARILIDATAGMIQLRTHQDDLERGRYEDYSEIWCPRFSGLDNNRRHEEPAEALAHALTHACEKVFEQASESIPELAERLRIQPWGLFRRLRQHLAALYPNEQTKPLIREFIVEQENYDLWPHHYEFQQMVRIGCERFGAELLSEEELRGIFEVFLSGPKREHYGEALTCEQLVRVRRNFHRLQFKPFESVLFGKYLGYFQQLEDETELQITDKDYLPVGEARGGWVRRRSPRPLEDLSGVPDEELLTFINEWDSEERYEREEDTESWLTEVNVEALAETFQSVFKDFVIPDATRLQYWLDHRDSIERPIYVRAMVAGMREHMGEGNFDELEHSLKFCKWVLSHPDRQPEAGYGYDDRSRERPHWHSARRAAGDLIGSCVEEDVNVPVTSIEQLADLLDALCSQFDARLDQNEPAFTGRDDQLAEAINNTRSRGLESLVKFGLWLKRHERKDDVHVVMDTLEKRFTPGAEVPLTLPEYAILGVNYGRLLSLNEEWAVDHRSDIFPQDSPIGWRAAFSALLHFTHPNSPTFNVLRDDFEFALRNLADLELRDSPRDAFTDNLGRHLFTHYFRGMYPLKEPGSLIEQFYQQTGSESEYWGNLFDHVGFTLGNTGKHLDTALKERLVAFFEWRLEAGEAKELARFSSWLEAECLEEEWRLDAFSNILETGLPDSRLYWQIESLTGLLPRHTAMVVECFAKLTDKLENDSFQILTEPAKRILKAGLDSSNEAVRANAGRARENLLRKGRFDLLDLNN